MLGVVNTLTISEAVAEKVLELISAGELVWGQRLPSQRELAAEHADKGNLHAMRQSLTKLEEAVQDNDPVSSKYDLEFHLALAESSHNPILLRLSSALRSSMEEFILKIDQTKKVVSCHWKVFKAIEKKDAVYAGRAMRALLNMTEHEYLRHLNKEKKSERSEKSTV